VAILELKKWGSTAGQRTKLGAKIIVYLAWWFFVVLSIKLPYQCQHRLVNIVKYELALLFTRDI